MTIPSIVGTGSASTNPASTTLNLNLAGIVSGSPPSAGDLILIEVMSSGTGATSNEFVRCSSSEGRWHSLGSAESPGVNAVFWKIRESGDGNTVTLTWGVSSVSIIGCHVIRGADTVRPIARMSKARVTNSSYIWDAETTPVADCLALATATIPGANRSLTSAASGWTKRIDNNASIAGATYFSQSQGFANSGTSTGTATTTIFGSGSVSYLARMILIQPPQTATPKDVRVKVGSSTSPGSTGNQDITVGFDVKALIITIADRNTDSVTTSLEWMVGIGADDGVTASDQRCVGVWHTSGGSSQAGYNSSAQIVQFYQSGNSTLASPNLKATYSKITNGFRLNWTAVIGGGVVYNWIAFGGADVTAKMQAVAANASPITGVAFRPELICALTAGINSATEQLRATADMSWGFLDTQTGAEFNVSMMANGSSNPVFAYRPNSFASEVAAGSLTWEVSHEQTTASGFAWVGSNTDELFLLMLGFGGTTYFPFEVESHPADSSGTANATQTLPAFARDLTTTTKQVVVTTGGPLTSSTSTAAAGGFIGIVEFDGNSLLDQDSLAISKSTSTSKRNRKTADSFYIQKTGDLSSPAKIGSFTSRDVITWSTNDTGINIIGLATIGWIGSTFTPNPQDTVAVTDSLTASTQYIKTTSDTTSVTDQVSNGLVKQKSISDTVSVSDSITVRRELGRSVSDTVVVSDSLAAVKTFIRSITDTCSVTDTLAARLEFRRVASDSVSVTDQLCPEVSRKISDTATVSDSLVATKSFVRTANDTCSVSDTVTVRRELFRQASDAVSLTEQLSAVSNSLRSTTDVIDVTDSLSVQRTLERSASDSIAVSDQFSFTTSFERSIDDAVTVSELLASTVEILAIDTCSVSDSLSKEHAASRAATDSVSSTDQLFIEHFDARSTSDSLTVSDALSFTRTLPKSVSDTCSVSDAASTTLVYGRRILDVIEDTDDDLDADLTSGTNSGAVYDKSFSESVSVTEILSADTRYVRSATDSFAVSDQVLRTKQAERSASDAVSVADQLSAASAYVRTATDAASVTDTTSRTNAIARRVSDSVSTSDGESDVLSLTRTISDAVSAADSLDVEKSFGRALSDTPATSDTITRQLQIVLKVSDAVSVLDVRSRAVSFVRSRTDSIASSDSIARKATFGRSRIDAISVADHLAVTIERSPQDAVFVSDSFLRAASSKRTFNDTAVVADVARRAVSYVRSAGADACSVTDHISPQVIIKKTDAVSTTDTFRRVVQFERYVPDAEETFDVVYVTRAVGKRVSDTIIVADRITAEPQRKISDSAVMTDSLRTTTPYVRKVTDAVVITDRLVRSASHVRTSADSISVNDFTSVTRTASRRLTDTASCTDVLRIEVFRRTVDTLAVTDQARASLVYARSISDAPLVVDALRSSLSFARATSDAIATTDAVNAGRAVAIVRSDSVAATDVAARAVDGARTASDAAAVPDSVAIYEVSFEVEVSDSISATDHLTLTHVAALSDVVTVADALLAVRTLGGKGADTVSVTDTLLAEKLSVPKDGVVAVDAVRPASTYVRRVNDSLVVADRIVEGDPTLSLSGSDDSVPGQLEIFAVNDGPLTMSSGTDSDTGPVGFVMRLGDLVGCADLIRMQLAIEISISDLAEVTD